MVGAQKDSFKLVYPCDESYHYLELDNNHLYKKEKEYFEN